MVDFVAEAEDPLKDYNGLSLFPHTLSSVSLPNPNHPPSDPHNFLKSLPVRNRDKLIKEASGILDNTTELPNPKMTNSVVSQNKNGAVTFVDADKPVKYPRGQRPGLDRKRPRFSLLPNIGQSSVNLEPTLDFDKLKDPEEFFTAFERLENAKKEIAKQTGRAFTDSDQYNVFNVPRSQRPGIEGRSRTAKYKHLYPTMPSQDASEVDDQSISGSQQETSYTASQQTEPANVAQQESEPIVDPPQQRESANTALEDMEITGSVAKVEVRVNKLLDDLLASEELEGDGAINLLQDRLQIKPLHIEKLNIPDIQGIQSINFKASEVSLPRPRNILSEINNLLKPRSNTPMKLKNIESSVHSVGSPTPPKSPFASLSLFKQRILQSNSSNDPFSADDIDQSSARNASHVEDINEYADPVDVEETPGIASNLNSQTNKENDGAVGSMSSTNVAVEDFNNLFKKWDENLKVHHIGGEMGSQESGPVLEDNNVSVDNEVINENLSLAHSDVNLQKNSSDELEDMVEDVQPEAVTSAQCDQETDAFTMEATNCMQNKLGQLNPAANDKDAAVRCPEIRDGAPEQDEGTALKQLNKVSINKQNKAKNPRKGRHSKTMSRRQKFAGPTMVEEQAMDGCPEHHDSAQEQNNSISQEQKEVQETSSVPMDEGTKAKAQSDKERKRKIFSKRQSLAGCGMSWESGIRRSTRIKSRPLEYWKGERFLYGRIHESLATVIGIKYASPGAPNLKVKSFVSDKFKDLVEQAALG